MTLCERERSLCAIMKIVDWNELASKKIYVKKYFIHGKFFPVVRFVVPGAAEQLAGALRHKGLDVSGGAGK